MSQEPALLDAEDTGESWVETPEPVEAAETDDVTPAETEDEQAESTEDAGEEAEAEEEEAEEEPSLDEVLAREDIDDEEFDRLTEKFPGLKKKLEWRQSQARDAAQQSARAEAAKRQKQENAEKYANGQLANEIAQYMSRVIENGDDPDPNQVRQLLGYASRSANEYHFQQANAAMAQAIDASVPEGGKAPDRVMQELTSATNKLHAGDITPAEWYAKRLEVFGEQWVAAKEAELRKKWEKEQKAKRADSKETERLKNSDAKRKSGTSPTTTQGTPSGDDPQSILNSPNATPQQRAAAFRAVEGMDLAEVFPEMR